MMLLRELNGQGFTGLLDQMMGNGKPEKCRMKRCVSDAFHDNHLGVRNLLADFRSSLIFRGIIAIDRGL